MIPILTIRDPLTESNSYILQAEGRCVVIDPNGEAVTEAIRQHHLIPDWILLTHEHCDHMGGLAALRAAFPEAVLCVSEACNSGIQNRRLNLSSIMKMYLALRGKPGVSYAPFTAEPADETFTGTREILWQGHTLRLVPLPGHSPGSVGIFLDQDRFFSGDYLLPGEEVILRFPGGDEQAYLEITKPFLDSLPDGIEIFPGHGERYVPGRT